MKISNLDEINGFAVLPPIPNPNDLYRWLWEVQNTVEALCSRNNIEFAKRCDHDWWGIHFTDMKKKFMISIDGLFISDEEGGDVIVTCGKCGGEFHYHVKTKLLWEAAKDQAIKKGSTYINKHFTALKKINYDVIESYREHKKREEQK